MSLQELNLNERISLARIAVDPQVSVCLVPFPIVVHSRTEP